MFLDGFGLGPVDFYESESPRVAHLMAHVKTELEDLGMDELFEEIPHKSCYEVKAIAGGSSPRLQSITRRLKFLGTSNCVFVEDWRRNKIPQVVFPRTMSHIINDAGAQDVERLKLLVNDGLRRDIHRFNHYVVAGLCSRKFPLDFRREMFDIFLSQYQIGSSHLLSDRVFASLLATTERGHNYFTHNMGIDESLNIMTIAEDLGILSGDVLAAFILHPEMSFSQRRKIFELTERKPELLTYSLYNSWNSFVLKKHQNNNHFPLTHYKPAAGARDRDPESMTINRLLYQKYLRLKHNRL